MTLKAGLGMIFGPLLVIAVLAAPSASASAPRPGAAKALTGTVTLSGTTDGYVPVTLSRTARLGDPFFAGRRSSVDVSGGGRLAGFALVRDGNTGAAIVGGHSDYTAATAGEFGDFLLDVGPGAEARREGPDLVLAPGSYRLYLVTSGKPTTVTLRFGGLPRSSRLSPTVRTASILNGGPARLDPKETKLVYSSGYDVRLPGPALFFSVFALKTSIHTETVTEYCFYDSKPQGASPYLPGCVSGDGTFGSGARFIYSDEYAGDLQSISTAGGLVARIPKGGGDFAAGLNVTTGSVVTDTDYAQVWLVLDASAKPSRTGARPSAAN